MLLATLAACDAGVVPGGLPSADLSRPSEVGIPDGAMPDLPFHLDLSQRPDLGVADFAMIDQSSVADQSQPPDLLQARADQSCCPDLSAPSDLSRLLDLAFSPDLSPLFDLTFSPDVSVPLDLADGVDLVDVADLSAAPDLSAPADLTDVSVAPDLSAPADLTDVSVALDMTQRLDGLSFPDLARSPDLSAPADLSRPADLNLVCPAPQMANDHTWADWAMPNPASAGLPNASSYDTSTSGVVVDTITGLSWQGDDKLDPGLFAWSDANTYCANLLVDGCGGWRLPTRIELVSLLDFTRANPAIDVTAFPSTPAVEFWTSSPSTFLRGPRAWLVNFRFGQPSADSVAHLKRVRCVR